jgi:putative membrane protein
VPTRRALYLLGAALVLLVISGIAPYDRFTWFLEVAPVLLGVLILFRTWRRFPLTPLVCWLLATHATILVIGGHYTYARVPLGQWVSDALGWQRNHYDRLGHLAQGFVPAILAREILLRATPLRRGGWLFFLVTCACVTLSALYELIEWGMALATGAAAEAFLGTQGDPWDTQWDMFLALCGALLAQVLLARVHDRQLRAQSFGVGSP